MACKYFKREYRATTCIGRENSTEILSVCLIKEQSEEKQMEVFSALAKKGLEKGFVNSDCPLAEEGMWEECPFNEADVR